MSQREKMCPQCNGANAGAKKQCACGYVFYSTQKRWVDPNDPDKIKNKKEVDEVVNEVVKPEIKEAIMNKIPADTMRRSVPIRVKLTMLEFVELIQKLRRIGIDTQLNIGIRG